MSDNRYNDPTRPNRDNKPKDSWDQDPFAPYDDPFINPEGTGAPLTESSFGRNITPDDNPYRPPVMQTPSAPAGRQRPASFTATPVERPAYAAPQQVSKHTTPARPADTETAAPRRGGRVARYHDVDAAPAPKAQPAGQPVAPPIAQPAIPATDWPEETRQVPRQADPKDRFSGARTVMPQDRMEGRPVSARDPYRPPVRNNVENPPRQRPKQAPQAPQARPRPVPPARMQDPAYGGGWQQPPAQPPMDPYGDQTPPRRGGRGLLILLIVLIVLGGAFAAVWLPDWSTAEGGIGKTVGSLQTSLKNLFAPEEIVIRDFSVQPDSGTAPVELSFVIYASTATETLRIVDDQGLAVLEKTLSDQDRLLGTVTKNSDGNNIWKLRQTFETAYTGNLTAQVMGKDGEWDTLNGLSQAVKIEPPMVFDPPIQGFLCSTVSDEVPVTVSFSIVSSLDVSAVRVVNDYGDEIARLTVNDAGVNMTETDENRVWTLQGTIEEAYSGSLYVGYEQIVGEGYTQSDYRETVEYTPASIPETTDVPAATPAPTATPQPTEAPTPEPTPTVEPDPTPTPSPTLMPQLSAQADDSEDAGIVAVSTTLYEGTSKIDTYSRAELINMLDSTKYAIWDQSGILTFRGGPLRQNAAFGTVEVKSGSMSELWKVPMDGTNKMNGVSLTGVSWPGQAAIVKWPTEVRQMLDIYTEMKTKTALKEVIVGAQNGKLYFLDLTTGEYTRDPIEIKWPSNGAVSVYTDGSPIVSFGQFYSIKADKTQIDNGLHLFSLISNKELTLIDGRDKPKQTNYSGFSGAPLFDKNTGAMVVGGQNGVLYLADFETDFDYIVGTLDTTLKYHRYLWTATSQAAKETRIDGSVAMYGPYAYFGDSKGVVQCVDVNTLENVWAVRTGDAIEGTPALDMSAEGDEVALYVGTTIQNGGREGTASFFRYDALSGRQSWEFEVPDLAYTTSDPVGIYASPVVGQNKADGLVFFTASNGSAGSILYALNKADGSVAWSAALTAPTESSPVAVYNEAGDAWIVQALADGQLVMLDAADGSILDTLKLDGEVRSSPAVYRNVLIISTTGKDPSYIYAITLE